MLTIYILRIPIKINVLIIFYEDLALILNPYNCQLGTYCLCDPGMFVGMVRPWKRKVLVLFEMDRQIFLKRETKVYF